MKKVLHLLSSNTFSGAENVVCQIINMLEENKDFEMIYCSVEGPIRKLLREKNISYVPLNQFSIKAIKEVINKYNPDIIHAHDGKASVIAALLSGQRAVISHIHGNHDNMKVLSIKSISYLIASKKFNHIFWVSNSCKDDYKYSRFVKNKSSVLYNVIDGEALKRKMNEDGNRYQYDCIFLGRLCDIKNPLRLIKILTNLIKKNSELKCAIVGDGELKKEIELYISQFNLNKNIKLLGFKQNPLKILHDSKVMVMTSRYEGTPMCALEAMLLGVPIVSTPTDGLKDLIEHNVTGFYSDNDEELESFIFKITSEADTRRRLSIEAEKKAIAINNINCYRSKILEHYN